MSWIQAWRAYDDDTLTALANAGLSLAGMDAI